jgi:hypothetical protein
MEAIETRGGGPISLVAENKMLPARKAGGRYKCNPHIGDMVL